MKGIVATIVGGENEQQRGENRECSPPIRGS